MELLQPENKSPPHPTVAYRLTAWYRRGMEPKRHPFPWWHVLDAPSLRVANGSVYRAVVALSLAYWAGGCGELPTDECTLAALCRLPHRAWREVKPETMQRLSGILPRLQTDHAKLASEYQRQVDSAHDMLGKAAARRLSRDSKGGDPAPAYTRTARTEPKPSRKPVEKALRTEGTFTD